MSKKEDYDILIKKDGQFYVGYCLEISQARDQYKTRSNYRYQKSNLTMQILS